MRYSLTALFLVAFTGLAFVPSSKRHDMYMPASPADQPSPLCSVPPDSGPAWLPTTPEPNETRVPDPRPASDCGFYRPAWQRFLVATQPTPTGPAFLDYPSFDQIFEPQYNQRHKVHTLRLQLTPRNIEAPNSPTPAVQTLLDQTQAGIGGAAGGALVDQRGRFIYYAINVNPEFRSFLQAHGLTTLSGLNNIDPNLQFPPGVMELKSAWMIVDSANSAPTYIVVPAVVQNYVVVNGSLLPEFDSSKKPVVRNVLVALIALHVVFTLPGHPEMIWSTFEHVHLDTKGQAVRDNAPPAPSNPPLAPTTIISTENFPLYKAGTAAEDSDQPSSAAQMVAHWDTVSQSFTKGGTLQTSVYRPYPGSKSNGHHPGDSDEDDEVILINNSVSRMFADAETRGLISDSDQRQNYRLVGAVWLDDPLVGNNASFKVGRFFTNPANQSTDDDSSQLAGEGRLGSTAMESFTEFEDGAPNCFSCHDTNAVRGKGGGVLVKPALLNVSHIMSRFKELQGPSSR